MGASRGWGHCQFVTQREGETEASLYPRGSRASEPGFLKLREEEVMIRLQEREKEEPGGGVEGVVMPGCVAWSCPGCIWQMPSKQHA